MVDNQSVKNLIDVLMRKDFHIMFKCDTDLMEEGRKVIDEVSVNDQPYISAFTFYENYRKYLKKAM